MDTDRGWAWVVLAASLGSNYLNGALVCIVGVVHSGLLEKFEESATLTAWVGAVYSSVLCMSVPVSSLVIGRFGCRTCSVVGGVLCFIGFVASAFVTSIYHLFFSFGIVAGVGYALGATPSYITIGFYFDKFRGLASGVSVAASAIGILSGPLLMQTFMDKYTVSGAFMLVGAICLHYTMFGMFFRPTIYERRLVTTRNVSRTSVHAQEINVEMGSLISSDSATACSEVPRTMGGQPQGDTKSVHEGDTGMPDRANNKGKNFAGATTADHGETDCEEPETRTYQLVSDHTAFPDAGQIVTDCHQTVSRAESLSAMNNGTTRSRADLSEERESQEDVTNTSVVKAPCDGALEESEELLCTRHHQDPPLSLSDFQPSQKTYTISRTKDSERVYHDSQDLYSLVNSEPEIEGSCASSSKPKILKNTGRSALCVVLRNKGFMCHCCGLFFACLTLLGVSLHLPEYAQSYGTSPQDAAALFVWLGLGSFVSRIITGVTTTDQTVDPLVLNLGLRGLTGVTTATFPFYSGSYRGQMVFSAVHGLYTGGQFALLNVVVVRFVGVSLLNAGFGVLSVFMGLGYLVGPPLAALIVDLGGTYEWSFYVLGCTSVLGSLLDAIAGSFGRGDRAATEYPPQNDDCDGVSVSL